MLKSLLRGLFAGPVTAEMTFEDRLYKLGKPMKLAVELRARQEMDVSAARVELECEERWVDTYVKIEPLGRTGGMVSRGKPMPGTTRKREVEKYTNIFVHSAAAFAEGARLRPDAPARYEVTLDVADERPPHAGGGTLRWRLVATIESGGESIEAGRAPVQIAVP